MEQNVPVYTIEEILEILPHRYPFLLIDKVTKLEGGGGPGRTGRKVTAIKNVTMNEPFFQGHFPHRPVMPGVLQVEVMAQAGALAAYTKETDRKGSDVAIVSIDKVKFRRPVVPGDTLEVKTEVLKDRGSMLLLSSVITVAGQKVAQGEMMAKIFPIEK